MEKAIATPASALAAEPAAKLDKKDIQWNARDFRYDKKGNLKVSLRRSSDSSRTTRENFEPDWTILQRVILPPPRKAASDAVSTLAGINSPPQIITIAEYGYLQFSKRLRVAREGKRMCFYVD